MPTLGRSGPLADIAAAMNTYFNTANVKTNMVTTVAYLVLGVLLCVMSVTMMVIFKG